MVDLTQDCIFLYNYYVNILQLRFILVIYCNIERGALLFTPAVKPFPEKLRQDYGKKRH